MKHTKYLLFFVLVVFLLLSCSKKTTESQDQCAEPTFSPIGGTYSEPQTVTISFTAGDTVIYTLNGSTPSSSSPVYYNPILVSETTTIKALAYRTGWEDSDLASVNYIIDIPTLEGFILVPGGTFTMGDTIDDGVGNSDELPTHTVTLNSFYIGTYEVTQSEWQAVMGAWDSDPYNSGVTYGVGDNYPVYYVSWYRILVYCNLRSMNEGLTPVYTISGSTNPANWGAVPPNFDDAWDNAICNWSANGYRLPTEAEWEYAARGATNDPDYFYSGSDDINAVAWYNGNSGNTAHPVGTKAPNGLSIFDMSGNVWEFCWDWYSSSYYSVSPVNNPTGPASGSGRLLRGGDWTSLGSTCRVALRHYYYPHNHYRKFGFRLCSSY